MGRGSWDTNTYRDAVKSRSVSGTPDFGYDNDVKTGKVDAVVHPDLNPAKVAGPMSPLAGKPIRESRDNDEHPNSVAIAVLFDVTGSMHHIPSVLQKKLPSLMDTIIQKTGMKDPQILFGAIGDSHCDHYPFQLGQFESDNKADEQLRNIILEGGGGGQNMESYGLAYRFAAEHTATDCFEKRGKKGYLFTIGDEMYWPTMEPDEIKKIFGVDVSEKQDVARLYAKASERFEIFHLHIQEGSYRNDPSILSAWSKLLGERLIKVEDANLICEIITGAIHMLETAGEAAKVAADIGLSGSDASKVSKALAPLGKNLPMKVAKGDLAKANNSNVGIEEV